jgi:TRAP-type mannitol/chloroaromatic compound transport system substrate-binding protein
MKRRDFLTGAAGAAAGITLTAGCGGGGPAKSDATAVHTTKRIRWRLASSFPRGLDTIYGAAEVLAERVSAMTGGNFEIRPYPAGELVPGAQVLDAVQSRTVQVGQTASYYYLGKNPALAFDTCVPFGLNSRQQTAWLHEGGGLELLRPLFADFGIINFPGGNTGAQMGGWFKREINSVASLQGLRIRIPGLGGEVMNALGATVQMLAGGDIYPALERGAIDATEWVGPYDDHKLGFHKIAKLYYYPGWWEPGPSLAYYVNQQAWDGLPAEYREIFVAATMQSATTMQARYDEKNPPALALLLEAGVQLKPFAPDIMEAARAASDQILAEYASKDPTYRAVYDAWSTFRAESFRWWGTAELAYAQFAFGS